MSSSPVPLQEGMHRQPLGLFHTYVQSLGPPQVLAKGVLAPGSTLSLMDAPSLALAGHWQPQDSPTSALGSGLVRGQPPSLLLGALIPCDTPAMTQVKCEAMSSPPTQNPTQHELIGGWGQAWGHVPSGAREDMPWDMGPCKCWPPPGHALPSGRGSTGHSIGEAREEPPALRSRAAAPNKCHVPLHPPHRCTLPTAPSSPARRGEGCKDGRGDIFIVSDTGCPRLSYFMQRAKEASLCYAAAGQAAQPSKGKDGRNAAGRGCVHAWVRACECVHTRATGHRFIQPFRLWHGSVHPAGRGRKVTHCLQTRLFF